MHSSIKKVLHIIGAILAVIGILFVTQRLIHYSAAIDLSRFEFVSLCVLAILILFAAASNLMLALAWWNLLGHFEVHVPRLLAVKIHGITQLAKYVPGNIFHHTSRQAMGMAAGMPGWPLAKSAVWEMGMIFASFGLFGLLALPLLVPGLPVLACAGLFAASTGIAVILLTRFIGVPAGRAFGWYVGFLVISALIFVGLVELLANNPVVGVGVGVGFWLPLGGAYVSAWLIGLVTPGAPAGVGVREIVLLFLLKGMVSEVDLLLIVLVGRLVTVTGDLLFFSGASILRIKKTQVLVGPGLDSN